MLNVLLVIIGAYLAVDAIALTVAVVVAARRRADAADQLAATLARTARGDA